MNKAELIDALAERLGDKKVAAAAVAGLVDVVVRAVNAGDKVTITGFGVFEKRVRAARVARNPRTGAAVTVSQTDVPTFRPGTLFREVVSGVRDLPRASSRPVTRRARPVAAVPPDRTSSAAPTPTTGSTASRPATRVTAAARPAAVHVVASPQASTKTAQAATKAAKVTKAAKASKVAKASKSAKTAAKAGKTVEPAKGEPKAAMKATAKAKGTAKKTGKKSATKK